MFKSWNKVFFNFFNLHGLRQKLVIRKSARLAVFSGCALATAGYAAYSLCDWRAASCQAVNPSLQNFSVTKKELEAVKEATALIEKLKVQYCIPGLSIAVEVNGRLVWTTGFGYADVEGGTPCTAHTVMRIASISKLLTATAAMQLIERGALQLDTPITDYITDYPQPRYAGRNVTITVRHLLSHLSGVRHYRKELAKSHHSSEVLAEGNELNLPVVFTAETRRNTKPITELKTKQEEKEVSKAADKEIYRNESFKSVVESLRIFQNDPLLVEPGTDFVYTSYGYNLLGAVLEKAAGERFEHLIIGLCRQLGMRHTYLDRNADVIANRARFYSVKEGRLVHTSEVDCSYKWASGGLLSTAQDVAKIGTAHLYSMQRSAGTTPHCPSAALFQATARNMWRPVVRGMSLRDPVLCMAQGWFVRPYQAQNRMYAFHTGGAVGASSVLLVLPPSANRHCELRENCTPRGVVVAMLVNQGSVNLTPAALNIAEIFERDFCKQSNSST